MNAAASFRFSKVLDLKGGRRDSFTQWPNPEESVGPWYREIGRLQCWELRGPAQEKYLDLAEEIKRHLEAHGEKVTATVVWSAYMIGKSKEKASPTVFFCSRSLGARRSVKAEIEQSEILHKYRGFRTGESNRPPHLDRLKRLGKSDPPPSYSLQRCDNPIGRLINVKQDGIPDKTTAATVGIVIQAGSELYFTTVLHAFTGQDLWDSQDESESEFELDEADFTDSEDDEDYLTSVSRAAVCLTKGNRPSIETDKALSKLTNSITVSNNEYSSRDIAFPLPSDYSVKEAIMARDYCLVRLDPADKRMFDITVDRGTQCSYHDCHPLTVAPRVAEHSKVMAYTGSRKGSIGAMSGTPTFLTLAGGSTTQELWSVHLEGTLEEGDCGSVVIDEVSHELLGHIVAGSTTTGVALIVPSYQVFDDLLQNFDPTVKLSQTFQNCRNLLAKEERSDRDNFHALTNRFRQLLSTQRMERLEQWLRQSRSGNNSWRSALNTGQIPIQNLPVYPQVPSEPRALRFQTLLTSLSKTPSKWDNTGLLDEALSQIPLRRIYEDAKMEETLFLAEAASLERVKPVWSYYDCVVRALMKWFREDFFTWINNPRCSACHSPTRSVGMAVPLVEESARTAERVELYQCVNASCNAYERFPRYQDAFVLMQTRRGRVGEWVNCFGMLCRALGAQVRWVWCREDHVWIEYWSHHRTRWIHIDVCEGQWDSPLLYTRGWGKSLSYCIAFSTDDAVDVTRRYVRNVKYASPRTRATEAELAHILNRIRREKRGDLSKEEVQQKEVMDYKEESELSKIYVAAVVSQLCGSSEDERQEASSKTVCPRKGAEDDRVDAQNPSFHRTIGQ